MVEKIKLFLNIILFNNWIDQKIKKDYLKKYLKEFFLLKTIVQKICFALLITLFCGLLFFLIRNNLLLHGNENQVVFNKGVAFSFLNSIAPQWVVYLVKSLISILFSFIFIFFNKWFIFIPSFLIAVNGWFNVIDKCMVDVLASNNSVNVDAVVDYIFILNSVSNTADVFIIIGICSLILGIMWYIYLINKEQKTKNKENKNDVN